MNEIETEQLCELALECLRYGAGSLDALPALIEKIIDNQAWLRRRVRTGEIIECGSLAELITAKPLKGWGESPDKIAAVLKSHPAVLAKFRKAMKSKTGPRSADSFCNNITETTKPTGTSKAYTCERLQRDAPELFAEVEAGRLSANAAAIAAGIRKKPSQAEIAVKAFRRAENRLEAMRLMIDTLEPFEAAIVRDWAMERLN